jgi:LemA protein
MLNCEACAQAKPSRLLRSRIVVWWISVAVLAIAVGYVVWTYNRLISLSKRADAAWSDIDVQLKRRWDLVPALVETVKGYARHESSTFEHVVAARGQATQAGSIADRGKTEQNLASAVGRLFAIAEAYPDLKASQNFQGLHKSLVDIENNVQYARRYYNAVVRDWNTLVGTIPSMWVAGAFGYGERPYFQLDESERAAPQVKLDMPPRPSSGSGPAPSEMSQPGQAG